MELRKRGFPCHQDQHDLLFDVAFKISRLIVIRQHEIGVPNEGWCTVVLEAHENEGNTNFISKYKTPLPILGFFRLFNQLEPTGKKCHLQVNLKNLHG